MIYSKLIFLLIFFTNIEFTYSAVRKKSLIYGETGRLRSFDPYTAHEASGHRLTDLLFDGLVKIGPGGSYLPSLAKTWDIRNAGTQVMVKLRKGVVWHDSKNKKSELEEFTAKDVITTLELLKNPKSNIPNSKRFSIISRAQRLNDHEIIFHFSRAVIDPMRYLMFKILPDHLVGASDFIERDTKFSKHPIGTGPYQFVGFSNIGEIRLIANSNYFDGVPSIESIIMKNYADQNIMSQALMYGSLDLITYVSPRKIDEINGDKRLNTVPYDALSYSFIALNNKRKIFSYKKVRQAFSYAINRQEMLDAFYYGKGRLVSGPFAPSSWAYNIAVKPFDYDPVKAKRLLSSVGIDNKSGTNQLYFEGKPIELTFLVPLAGESETLKRIVLAYQGYLSDIGISIKLKFVDWFVWKNKVLKMRDFDLTLASWSFDDAANIFSLFHSQSIKKWGNNFIGFSNSKIDQLLNQNIGTSNFDKRRSISHKLHALLAEEAPYTFLWNLEHHAAHNKLVSGVRIEPFSFFRYINTWHMRDTN